MQILVFQIYFYHIFKHITSILETNSYDLHAPQTLDWTFSVSFLQNQFKIQKLQHLSDFALTAIHRRFSFGTTWVLVLCCIVRSDGQWYTTLRGARTRQEFIVPFEAKPINKVPWILAVWTMVVHTARSVDKALKTWKIILVATSRRV